MRPERKSPTSQNARLFKPGQQLTNMELQLEQYIRTLPKQEQGPARAYLLVYLQPRIIEEIRLADEQPTRDEIARFGLMYLQQIAGKPFWKRIVNGCHIGEAKQEQSAFISVARSNV